MQVLRATHGTSPLPAGSIDRLHAIRGKIDMVPSADLPREDHRLILLELARQEYLEYGMSYIVPESNLSQLCRSVGSSTLRKMIRSSYAGDRTSSTDFFPADPDIRPQYLRWFIMEHAKDLLVAEDAESVLAAGNAIAAAELRPAMASQWLRAALDKENGQFRGWERAKIVAALWRITGPADTDFIVNWYFTDPAVPRTHPSARTAFLELAVAQWRPEMRDLLATIISDPRFDQTGPDSARTLVRIINPWLPKPLATDEEIRDSYHHDEPDSNTVKFEPLPQWHRKLRDSIPAWNPKP